MSKRPRLMDLSRIRDILGPHLEHLREHLYLSPAFGILHGAPEPFRFIMQQEPPFIINDHRFGIVIRGEGDINFNLVDHHISAPALVYIGPGTIITPLRFSSDLEIYGIGLFSTFPMPFASGQWPSAFNGQVRDFQLQVSSAELNVASDILQCVWELAHQHDFDMPTVSSLVGALMQYYDHLFRRQADQQSLARSREQTIFDRFIQLVNLHCREQHQISYYATRMCLTERYLSTVVRQTSDTTAKDWIDRALVTRNKRELRHTEKSASQLAEEFHFANPSFFSKYFRRLTGMTPLDFRQG